MRFVEREILGRNDGIRRREIGVFEGRPGAAHRLGEPAQRVAHRRLVTRLERSPDLVVELVEPDCDLIVDPPLAFAHHADDHVSNSFFSSAPASSTGASPWPSSAFIFASSSSTWLPCESAAS